MGFEGGSPLAGLTVRRFILAGVRHHWRTHLAVGLGVGLSVAVLSGSLLVGHSAQATLRQLNLRRVGPAALWVRSARGIPEGLVDRLSAREDFPAELEAPVGLFSLSSSVTEPNEAITVPEVRVFGVDSFFWRLFPEIKGPRPEGRHVLINASLAQDLGVDRGDALIVRMRRERDAPVLSLFGRREREDVLGRMRLVVDGVIAEGTLKAFDPASKAPRSRTLFMDRNWLNKQVGEPEEINRILFPTDASTRLPGSIRDTLTEILKETVSLQDVGLSLSPVEGEAFRVLRSDRLVLSESFAERVRSVAQKRGFSPVLVSIYLANSLRVQGTDRSIPYSVVASLDPLPDRAPLAPDEILLNGWAADDLAPAEGDTVAMKGFLVDSEGRLLEVGKPYRFRDVAPMEWSFVAPWLVPEVEGVTDGDTIHEWDTPFPVERDLIREKDEAYWETYRTTPKAFLAPSEMKAWWDTGDWINGVIMRPPRSSFSNEAWTDVEQDILDLVDPPAFGLDLVDLRGEALDAAKGSTDFGGTFLAMSFFLVVAAAFWVGLLLRLNVQTRAKEYGVLASVGFKETEIARLLSREAWCVSLVGGVLGMPLAVVYAGWVLEGLRTRWRGALGAFRFELDLDWLPLALGFLGGVAVAGVCIRWGVRDLKKRKPLELLWGWASSRLGEAALLQRGFPTGALVAVGFAVALFVSSSIGSLLDTTLAFFGVGAALLISVFLFMRWGLRGSPSLKKPRRVSVWAMAFRSAKTNRLRSLLTFSIMSLASFIVVTVAANEMDLMRLDPWDPHSGTGGFSLVVFSEIPLFQPLVVEETVAVFPMRLRKGDGVSCLDLQRPNTPRVLSVPEKLIQKNAFSFVSTLTEGGLEKYEDKWLLLKESLPPEKNDQEVQVPVVPAFMDAGSAQWILKKKLGDTIEMRDKEGDLFRLKLVGLLSNSLFAAEVLISEDQFLRIWGGESGYQRFLVDAPRDERDRVAMSIRHSLGELGVDVAFSEEILAGFAQVQNAYLGAFRLLGGFSMLWGGLGVAVSLLRGVAERRKELAMMMAVGLSRSQLAGMIVLENGVLLLLGVLAGTISALVAVLPHLFSSVASVNWHAVAGTLCLSAGGGLVACAVAAAGSVGRDLLSALRFE